MLERSWLKSSLCLFVGYSSSILNTLNFVDKATKSANFKPNIYNNFQYADERVTISVQYQCRRSQNSSECVISIKLERWKEFKEKDAIDTVPDGSWFVDRKIYRDKYWNNASSLLRFQKRSASWLVSSISVICSKIIHFRLTHCNCAFDSLEGSNL